MTLRRGSAGCLRRVTLGFAAGFLVCAILSSAQPAQSPATPKTPATTAESDRLHNDWANLAKYRDANAKAGVPTGNETRVVFMGDSITEGWVALDGNFFASNGYIGRGISGQTTPQMLVRFRPDVIDLKPKAVVILAGTNDIAGNTGPSTPEMIEGNLKSMAELARANGIRVVLASVLPAYDYPWKRGMEPAPKIVALNKWLKDYAAETGAIYLDFYTPMADARGGLKTDLSPDGVHPNAAGYAIMDPLAKKAIAEALATP